VALPIDQVVRGRRFLAAHPEWTIYRLDKGRRFTAEKGDGDRCHVVVGMSLRELLDKLDEIAGGPA
jgi:hypothetical protein